MIYDNQKKSEAMERYFRSLFTHKRLLDEELNPNTKSQNPRLIVDFDRDDVSKGLSIFGTKYLMTEPNELHPEFLNQISKYVAAPIVMCAADVD